MTAKEVIKSTMDMSHYILTAYLGDLSDADLMVRSVPGANHIAWQLGHLISSERMMLSNAGFAMPDLPDGFAESYTKETSPCDDASKFHTKDVYFAEFSKQREATIANLDSATDEDFAKATPEEMHAYAPNVGAVFNMIGIHVLMHVGQFVAVRRMLDKPVTI
ncbi:MAG: DinB family protein [Planctomycetota bacterium]|jgi:hypothetical protein